MARCLFPTMAYDYDSDCLTTMVGAHRGRESGACSLGNISAHFWPSHGIPGRLDTLPEGNARLRCEVNCRCVKWKGVFWRVLRAV